MLLLEIDIALTGKALGITCLVILLLVFGLVFFMRSRFSGFASSDHSDDVNKSLMGSRTKYPQVNALSNFRTPLTLLGLALSIGLTTLAFGWTQYEKTFFIPDDALEIDDDIEVEPPRTAEPPPPPPSTTTTGHRRGTGRGN